MTSRLIIGEERSIVHDASVGRNFAIVGWVDVLRQLSGGRLQFSHGVIGLSSIELADLERIRDALDREGRQNPSGSGRAARALGASIEIERLIVRRGTDLEVLVPSEEELQMALDLQAPSTELRSKLQIRARRLDAGEAVSIAIATSRDLEFASDDNDGRRAYLALGGSRHWWTLDLVQEAVRLGLLTEVEARAGYDRLLNDFDFWGADWP